MIALKEFRGHIRNWKELCTQLNIPDDLTRNEREKSIIEKAFLKWGNDIGNHLNGSFAFVLFDEEKDELFLIRDQFGTKPIYYFLTENQNLLVGTMIRDIIKQEGFVKELDASMLQIYLSLTYLPGEDTFFKGLKKLLPGHYLIFKNKEIQIGRYFKPELKPTDGKTLEEVSEEIHTTLKQIFTEIKDEDETAESFLSGGVDSSYIFAMSDAFTSSSCGYENERFDESYLAKQTAAALKKENITNIIQPEDYFKIVPYVMYNMELPLGDASAIAFALGCIETAKRTKLCYSGEGADEFFCGYNMYKNAERYGENLKTFYVGNTNIMKEDEKKLILKEYKEGHFPINYAKPIYEENEDLDPVSKMSLIDILIWLDGDIYLNVDKMGAAAGLDIRMPLTDTRIFDIASKLPTEYKLNEEENKIALRLAASKVLPHEIAYRKKVGFIVPIRLWLADSRYNQDVIRLFNSDIADKFFVVPEIKAIFQDYIDGNSDNWRKVWTIYTFLVWYEEYFVKR